MLPGTSGASSASSASSARPRTPSRLPVASPPASRAVAIGHSGGQGWQCLDVEGGLSHMPDMRLAHVHPLRWLGQRDRGFAALRRATRAAIIMPAMFALGDKVIGNPQLATFAAFGSFAMLLLVDFGGPMAERLQAQAALAVTGGVFVCLATLASQTAWLAAVAMAVVGVRRDLCWRGQLGAGRGDHGAAAGVHLAGIAGRSGVGRARPAGRLGDGREASRWWRRRSCGPRQRATGCVVPRPPRAGRWPPGCVRGSRTCSAGWTDSLRWIAITRLRRRTRPSRPCAVPSWRRPTAQPG